MGQYRRKIEKQSSKVAIIAVGSMLQMAIDIEKKVKEEAGIEITVINPRFLTGLDEELLNRII
ncbi:transketolase C-terminal domain-containing protein [Clostridium beijerinckii]|uniref:transketolase C-terminal domain-containing protein n=1 Tax=Clostridium beijerinckii TaxID=1520 RepID=UPI000B0726B7|nr:transketolase C-terminal domain-containing protein [Clostridium beijerinckii]